MKTCLPLLLTVVWLIWPGGAAVAQARRGAATAARRPDARPKTTSRISLVKTDRNGDQALVIGYPWKVHLRPSVEVRLVTGKDPGAAVVRPLFFRSEYMKGKVTVAVYRCQDMAAGVPVRKPLTAKGIELEILGRRNSLAKPSVCVVRRFAREEPGPDVVTGEPASGTGASEPALDTAAYEPALGTAASEPVLGTAAVFCLLPAWAINKR